ncbi:MAG: hypothetical protein ACK2UH_01260 [Candidatus Promineifilaceae bacterium]|jgi:hypothetical protein
MFDKKKREERPIYHIRVQGQLDDKWAGWFDGFAMQTRDDGVTLLSGPADDQAALHGVLDKLHGLGLPLLLVTQADCPCTSNSCSRRGHCDQCAGHYEANGNMPYCFRARNGWDKNCAKVS